MKSPIKFRSICPLPAEPPTPPPGPNPDLATAGGRRFPTPTAPPTLPKFLAVLEDGTLIRLRATDANYDSFVVDPDVQLVDRHGTIIS